MDRYQTSGRVQDRPNARSARARGGGYLASLSGSALGGLLGGVLGAFLGTLFLDVFVENQYRISVIATYVAVAALGFWYGLFLGCWLMLRWKGQTLRRATTGLLALLSAPPIGYFLYILPGRGISWAVLLATVGYALILAPLLSRFLVLQLGHYRSRSP